MNMTRMVVVCLMTLTLCSALAAEDRMIRDNENKLIIAEQKAAQVIIAQSLAEAAVVEYWVVREKSGKCVIGRTKPRDASLIFKGPFRERREAEVIIKECRPTATVIEYTG